MDRKHAVPASVALVLCTIALAACGGEGQEGPTAAETARSDVGTPLTATNDGAGGVVAPGATNAPSAGVVEGGPDQSQLDDIAPPDEEALANGTGSCGAVDAEPSAATLGETSQSILCLLNVERTSRGLARLTMNSRLTRAAKGHSDDMVQHVYFAHDAQNGGSMLDRIKAAGYLKSRSSFTVGENIGWGSGTLAAPRSLVKAWMNSPPHRANILQSKFRELGVGLTLGAPAAGITGTAITATTNFGRLSAGR
jgi:uncharacterized protein YkwD